MCNLSQKSQRGVVGTVTYLREKNDMVQRWKTEELTEFILKLLEKLSNVNGLNVVVKVLP